MTFPVEIVVKTSLVLVVALGVVVVLRHRSAALRHWVLSAAVLSAALLPAVARLVPVWHVAPYRAVVAPVPPVSNVVVTIDAEGARGSVPPREPVSAAAPGVPFDLSAAADVAWAAGAGLSLLILVVGFARLAWLASGCRVVTEGSWRELLTTIAAEQGVTRRVRLLQSEHPTLLVTWGSRLPTILLPRGACAWTADRMRVVLHHEIAHIRRGDWVVQVLAEVVRSAYWFNPIVWIACARLRQESEHACDDAVIGAGVDPADYASHLVDLARAMRSHRQAWLPAHGIAKPSKLEERVSAMLNARVNRSPMSPTNRLAAAGGVLAVAVLVAGFGPQAGTTVSGTVVDVMGRPLAGQTLTLSDGPTPSTHPATTDASGAFAFAPVPPGDYVLRTERLGFEPFEERITLAGDKVQRTLKLQLATIQETIRVTDAPAPPPAPPAPPVGKIGPPSPQPAPPKWLDLRNTIRAKRANDPCATSPEGGCILPPVKLKDVRPIFPESLKGSGIAGIVTLTGTVATDGTVQRLQVVSTPHADLSAAAIAAVGQWLFEPTLLDGTLVETPITISVGFNLTR